MSAAESLSVGSVASIASQVQYFFAFSRAVLSHSTAFDVKTVSAELSLLSQEGGLSQTSAALSHHGAFGAAAALSTTQPSVVSNANETALSAVHEGHISREWTFSHTFCIPDASPDHNSGQQHHQLHVRIDDIQRG